MGPIRRSGAGSELDGAVPLDQVRVLEDKAAIAREGGQPLISPEAVVIAPFPLITTGTDANVQIRGVTPIVLKVRKNVRIVRMDQNSSLALKTRTVDHPAAETSDSILHGRPVADSITAPIMLRSVVPPDES